MYLGAVVGSSGLMSSDATASLISRDIVPDAESFNPNRSLRELFVNCSPCTCLMQITGPQFILHRDVGERHFRK